MGGRGRARACAAWTDLLLNLAAESLARLEVGPEKLGLPLAERNDGRAVLCRRGGGRSSSSSSRRGRGLGRGDLGADRLANRRRRLLERARRGSVGKEHRERARKDQHLAPLLEERASGRDARRDGEVLEPRRRRLEALDDGREVEAWSRRPGHEQPSASESEGAAGGRRADAPWEPDAMVRRLGAGRCERWGARARWSWAEARPAGPRPHSSLARARRRSAGAAGRQPAGPCSWTRRAA